MSLITPELGDDLSGCGQRYEEITYHTTLLPEPARKMRVSMLGVVGRKREVRLPWTHRREGDDFHSSKILPWKNQDVVPLWWALRAILLFVEGSGGESHS